MLILMVMLKEIESLIISGCSSLETLVIPDNIADRGIAYGAFPVAHH